uniref:Uncharacterized protein n=1 Tax=Pseudonaja textilis TaxID=8673 RepID=A0A670Z6N4_PSETE
MKLLKPTWVNHNGEGVLGARAEGQGEAPGGTPGSWEGRRRDAGGEWGPLRECRALGRCQCFP